MTDQERVMLHDTADLAARLERHAHHMDEVVRGAFDKLAKLERHWHTEDGRVELPTLDGNWKQIGDRSIGETSRPKYKPRRAYDSEREAECTGEPACSCPSVSEPDPNCKGAIHEPTKSKGREIAEQIIRGDFNCAIAGEPLHVASIAAAIDAALAERDEVIAASAWRRKEQEDARVAQAVKDEREECAKVIERSIEHHSAFKQTLLKEQARLYADAIRNRGKA